MTSSGPRGTTSTCSSCATSDLLPQAALQGKVVLPLATGGTVAHLLTHIDRTSGGPVLIEETARDCIRRTAAAFREALGEADTYAAVHAVPLTA